MRLYEQSNMVTCKDCKLNINLPSSSKVKQLHFRCSTHKTELLSYSVFVKEGHEVDVVVCPHCYQ